MNTKFFRYGNRSLGMPLQTSSALFFQKIDDAHLYLPGRMLIQPLQCAPKFYGLPDFMTIVKMGKKQWQVAIVN